MKKHGKILFSGNYYYLCTAKKAHKHLIKLLL